MCNNMNRMEGLVQRKNLNRDACEGPTKDAHGDDKEEREGNLDDGNPNEVHLTLMEEVLLLGLHSERGVTSYWNDCISSGLRGCMLVELALRGRVELEHVGIRHKRLLSRKLIAKNETPTGDVLLDQTLKHIKEAEHAETVDTWLEYLSGESWNPLKMRYQLKNVRERLAKNLVEKGVVTPEKLNYFFFDSTRYILKDKSVKCRLVKKVQDALLTHWTNDARRMNKRTLALILLAYASDVLQNAFRSLNDTDHDLVMKRVRELCNCDFGEGPTKNNAMEIVWTVFATFSN